VTTQATVTARPRAPIAALRIAFGLVWLFDASLKWSPAFVNNFTGYVDDAKAGQSGLVRAWLDGWTAILGTSPHLFARLVAVTESVVALCLILGLLTNAACVVGSCLSLAIWSTAEGFGGPYMAGSTDVGASIVYVLLFGIILFSDAGARFGLDTAVRHRLGRLRWLSSAGPTSTRRVGATGRARFRVAMIGVLGACAAVLFVGLSTALGPIGGGAPSTAAMDGTATTGSAADTGTTGTMASPASGSMTGGGQDAMDPGGQGNVRR
jgi:thiosulfate dehydrogenase (quinone) large subunit